MDSTTTNNDILMRLINNALYWQKHIVIIIVTLVIVIDINEQRLLIPVGYSIDHDKKCTLNGGRAHFELYFLEINRCTDSI